MERHINEVLPNDFNWEVYLKLNKDLPRNYNGNECINHYLKFGKNENRFYKTVSLPEDFNWKTYLILNKDLSRNLTKKETSLHYLTFGKKENRDYKFTLDNIKEVSLFYYGVSVNETSEIELMEKMPINNNINSEKTIFIDSKENDFDSLNCDFLVSTKLFNNVVDNRFLHYKADNDILNVLNSFILVIDFQNGGGGTTFFINTIVSKYKNYQTFVIARNYDGLLHLNINEEHNILKKYNCDESLQFLKLYRTKIDKVFINHKTGHSDIFLNELFTLNKEIVTITHDYSLITECCQPYYHKIKQCMENNPPKISYNKYDIIISQNKINTNVFSDVNYIVKLPDFSYSGEIIDNDNDDDNSKTVIGIIGNINDIKGRRIFKKILKYFKNNEEIEFIVIGYIEIKNFTNYYYYNNINEFNKILVKTKPKALLELSLWPETYSYSLTLAMLTQLPIFTLKKCFESVVENRLKSYNKYYYFSTINELNNLINSKTQNFLYTIKPYIYYNKFWNELFITNKNKIEPTQVIKKSDFSSYLIYFPQFHPIKENDVNFYKNYTDIVNLKKYNLSSDSKLDEPLLNYLSIDNIESYNLENKDIVQKQINLLNLYDLDGFAMYYYWFSHNNITNKNMIMENVINNFFNGSLNLKNKKIFFIWANENWTNNDAFGNNDTINIENMYNESYFYKNAENLLQYFKHSNYLKKNNKPVFFIYHSHLIDNELIDIFYNILNELCVKNNFAGVHFVLNSFISKYVKYPNFYINFNYKKNDAQFYDENKEQLFLDYKKYMDNYNVPNNTIQTIVFDFNNKPRLFEPNRLNKSTVCIKNTEINKIIFAKKITNSYRNIKRNDNDDDIFNILLINSFNEWGENMSLEPGAKYEYYNLNLLKFCLESK